MSNKKRRRAAPGSYREPARAPEPPARSGVLSGMLGGVPRFSPMPTIRAGLARAVALVGSTPALLVGVPVVLLAGWLVLVAAGFQGPFRFLNAVFAAPGVGTFFDGSLSSLAFGGSRIGQLAIFPLLVMRSVLLALVATVAIERLRTGSVSVWSARRALRVLPVALTANVAGLALLLAGSILGQFVGRGFSLLAIIGAMAGGAYLMAAAPAIAADEARGMGETMQRSIRAARMPGTMNLTLAVLYTLAMWAAGYAYTLRGVIGVNPPISEWVWVIGLNLFHVVALVLFAYRYLAVADAVPEGPLPKRSAAARRPPARGRR